MTLPRSVADVLKSHVTLEVEGLVTPKKAPCPECGKHGNRKHKLPPRQVRTVAYQRVAYLELHCGEYQARCSCCKTFRNSPEQVLPRALYDNKVRDLVLGRIIGDGMSIEPGPARTYG